jgi:hypothetical protein
VDVLEIDYSSEMSGEIKWEEETEVKEVIADIRDPDCELNWYSKI